MLPSALLVIEAHARELSKQVKPLTPDFVVRRCAVATDLVIEKASGLDFLFFFCKNHLNPSTFVRVLKN